jgi:hypothetical protein
MNVTQKLPIQAFHHILIKTSTPIAETVKPFANCIRHGHLGNSSNGGNMALNFGDRQKQIAAEFWKSYFAKFRRQVSDHEESETGNAPLSACDEPVSMMIERRRTGPRLGVHLRR